MRHTYLLLFLLLLSIEDFAFNKQNITLHKFTLKESLPGSSVKRVFQDNKGFMWFGTESGICRYDGYNLLVIKSTIEHPNLLTSGNILCIEQDKQNRIWFGTDRGVNVIDENNQIVPVISDARIQNLRINSIVCDKKGNVWIGSENGLFLYKDEKTPIQSFYHVKRSGSIPGNNVNCIFEDKNGAIWIALWHDGLCIFNEATQQFVRLPQIGRENNPFVVFQDSRNDYWVGTWVDGLFKFRINKINDIPKYEQCKLSIDRVKQNLYNKSIYSITEDRYTGNLWVLSHSGVSIITNKKTYEAQHLNTLEFFDNASNYLNQIYRDRQGNLWIATLNDGVYLANLRKPQLNSNTLSELKRTLGYIEVDAFIENGDRIWLGLKNFGVYTMDRATGGDLKPLADLGNFIMYNPVRCFARNKQDNSIWIGGNNSLAKVDPKTSEIVDLSNKIEQVIGLGNNNISAMLSDSKKNMWVASRRGLICFRQGKIELLFSEFNNVQTLAEDKSGNVWAGSPSKGILKITTATHSKMSSKVYNLANGKINSNEINSIFVDNHNEIWVATNNGGLNKYQKNSDSFASQNKTFNILDQDIKAINSDSLGNLWLSTNNKIIKIEKKIRTSILFSSTDFSETNYYKPSVAFRDSKGKLYFGGGNGYVSFYGNLKKHISKPNLVTITDIQIHNKSIFSNFETTEFDAKTQTLELNYHQRNLSLEFSALNYNSATNINYAYRLSGVDKNWVYVDYKRRYINYNNLTKGKYLFEVKATDENGVWLDKTCQLNVIVLPAPYETWWAYLLYVLVVALILMIVYRTVVNRIRLRRDLLISRISQEKMEELTQLKLSYFTNISHELLTPLTIISCLIDDFHLSFPNKFKQYSIMKSNIIRLKRLLQQILDFRKVETGNMKLSINEGDLVAFVKETCLSNFEPLAKKKNLKFEITGIDALHGCFDSDKIDKVLFNILSNAFKYTNENGVVNLSIQALEKNGILYALFMISDTGSGIDPERLPYIFDRFYGNEATFDSNGIGLSLTKELVELHKGSIKVESQLNAGTTFILEIPIDKFFYKEDEKKSNQLIDESNENFDKNDFAEMNLEPQDQSLITKTGQTLLVVEDNPDLRMVISNSLSRMYNVVEAVDGVEALKMLSDIDVDIVVSDIMMPEMDGITLCKTIKGNVDICHTPVLLLTAKNQIADRVESYNAGADAYISKPFEMEVLIARINSLLFNRKKVNHEFQSAKYIPLKRFENDSIDDQFMRDAIAIVEKNLSNFEFTHEQLIVAMNTSKSTFYRKVKSLTGLAPNDFVRNIRLKHACQMLKNESGNISDISYAVGFSDPKYFSTCFKAEFGLTPREYMKKKRPTNTDED